MSANGFLEHVALADEQIGVPCNIDQHVGPLGVPRIAENFSSQLDTVRKAGANLVVVVDMKRLHSKSAQFRARADREFTNTEFEWQFPFAWKGCGKQAAVPLGQSGRAGNGQRAASFADELGIEDEERHAAEMIEVEMSEQNEIDRVSINVDLFHRDQRRCAAIDQEIRFAAGNVETCIEAAAGTECVAAPHKLQTQI